MASLVNPVAFTAPSFLISSQRQPQSVGTCTFTQPSKSCVHHHYARNLLPSDLLIIANTSPPSYSTSESPTKASVTPSPSPTETGKGSSSAKSTYPDAGLIPKAGITGTTCTNLFPLPILGGYGWFLNVYKRDKAANTGPFILRCDSSSLIRLFFRPGQTSTPTQQSDVRKSIKGIVAGNLNVKTILKSFNSKPSTTATTTSESKTSNPSVPSYEVRCFERGSSEFFFQRHNELQLISDEDEDESKDIDIDIAPTYRTISKASNDSFEIRNIYASGGEAPKEPAVFEWFSMNLFPIFPLAEYSAFVCVWKQNRDTSSIAIHKTGKEVQLRVFDPLPLPKDIDEPSPVAATFAVRKFKGAITDNSATSNYQQLISDIQKESGIRLVSQSNEYRIVVDNTPNTFTWNRCSEIWVEVKAVHC